MTKLKNTKKGMAKKALSISLVAAMLATSNVPVWAAEDLFSDGSAAVEAPAVVEEPAAVFSSEEAPAEAEETTEAQALSAGEEINTRGYVVKDLKIEVGDWNTPVSVSGSITDKGGNELTGCLQYIWLADGVQAAGTGAVSDTFPQGPDDPGATVEDITYTPTKADFNKTLSVEIYVEGGTKIFSTTVTGGKVKAVDLSDDVAVTPTVDSTINYNGKEQKVIPTNYKNIATAIGNTIGGGVTITPDQLTWSYTTEGNDFTNVTDKNITVVGTLQGTYDKTSTAYGYTFTSKEAKYRIEPMTIEASDLSLDLKKTSVSYTGKAHTFKPSDITVSVEVDNNTKVDITDAIKSDATFTGDNTAVGKNNKLSIAGNDLYGEFATTDAAKKILKNFDRANLASDTTAVISNNSYEITTLNLSNCTGEVTTEYQVDAFKNDPTVAASNIKLTTPEGESFTLDSIEGSINIAVNQVAKDAADAGKTGVISNAITVSYKTDTKNVTGSISLPITLTTKSLALADVKVSYNNGSLVTLSTNKNSANNLEVPYIGKKYDLQNSSVFSNFAVTIGSETLQSGEYSVSYDDNVNAGVVTVTITGKGSYAGSTKKVYFKIDKADVIKGSLKVKDSVTVNPSNNYDASLYKTAMDTKIETTLDGSKVTLVEGTDYTVKYYYANTQGLTTEAAIKNDEGTNIPGNYVYAVATPVKDGNYEFDELIASSEISNKSISNVTVTVEKDTYTFTGKEIIPNVTVKDGSVTLEKGIDYTVNVKDNVNVGTATITIKPTADSEYDTSTSATATFTIEAAKAEDVKVVLKTNTVDDGKNTFNYTGRQIKPSVKSVTLNGVDVTKYFDVTYPVYGDNVDAGKEAGSVTITPKASPANFTGTKTQLFDIKGIELKGTLNVYEYDKSKVSVDNYTAYRNQNNNDIYTFYYDGEGQTFTDEVFSASGLVDVTEGTDYEVKYLENVDAGYGFVAVIAKGNYEGNLTIVNDENAPEWYSDYSLNEGKLKDWETNTVVATNIVDIIGFHINATTFTAKNITVANGEYAGGMPVKPQVTITVNGKTLTEDVDYELELWSVDGETKPEQFTSVTAEKPYMVRVIAKGGYTFDDINGSGMFLWGIDKKDLAKCLVNVTKRDDKLELVVMNGNVVETKESFDVKDNGDGTATVSVVDGGKNYTGSTTVSINDTSEDTYVGQPVIKEVKVVGNKATVVLEGEAEDATGYDYVISTVNNYTDGRLANGINKNQLSTETSYQYLDQGIYYAYCHAWKRVNGVKVFGEWSNIMPFSVTSITPEQPTITSVKKSGRNVTVTWTQCDDAQGYDVVLGTAVRKVNGELRPVEYGKAVKKVGKNTYSVTFKSCPKGATFYAGLHAWNRTSETGVKVFSPWSDSVKVTI